MAKKTPNRSTMTTSKRTAKAGKPTVADLTHAPAPTPTGAVPVPGRRTKPKPPSTKAEARSKPKRASGLDAAAKVLVDAGEPMRCGDLVKQILDKGLWKTGGKTPAATINAAIIREIRSKGKASRFRKTGRGLFTAAKGG